MDIKNIFRILLITSTILVIFSVLYPEMGFHSTSKELEILLMWEGHGSFLFDPNSEIEWNALEIVLAIVVTLLLIAYIVGLIGTLLFKRWCRNLLAGATVLAIAFSPVWGITVYLPFETLLAEVSGAMFYIALTMAFLPPLNNAFQNKPNKLSQQDAQKARASA